MSVFTSAILPFLIYWLILFVACYMIVEYGQTYLYDETTPSAGLKVALGTLLFAAFLTWTRSSFESMFTTDIARTFFLAVMWFAIFIFVFRFHPVHAFAIGLVACFLLSGAATLAVNSMTGNTPASVRTQHITSKPVRTTLQTNAPVSAPAKSAEDSQTPSKESAVP
jgi:hypothetical protein